MMNEQYLLENLMNECNQLNDNLRDEYLKLNQEMQELYGNSNVNVNNINGKVMFNPYPTPEEAPLDIDENILKALSSYNQFPDGNQTSMTMANNSTFDPIAVSNGLNKNTNIGSEMSNFVEDAPLGNVCNDIDFNDLNQNLLSMQENLVNLPMDASIESIIADFKNNSVSLLETTYSDINGNMLNDHSLEGNLVSKNEADMIFSQLMENVVSKT